MKIHLRTDSIEDYRTFLKVKRLPVYEINGHVASFPDEYAHFVGLTQPVSIPVDYQPSPFLFDYQRDISAMAIRKRKFAGFIDCGLGKGLRPDCPVLTPGGWRSLDSITAGESVIGADGWPTEVTGVFRRGVQPMYRVTFDDGVQVECDADHLWSVKSYNDVARGKPWRTLSTASLASTQLKYGTHGQSRTWQIPLVQEVFGGDTDELPLHPYILGVLLGDGSLGSITPTWTKNDPHIAKAVAGFIPCTPEPHEVHHRDNGDDCDSWSITSPPGVPNMVAWAIRDLGLFGKLSHEKFVPQGYLDCSPDGRLWLLRGLMDTDGYSGETPEFSSASVELATAVRSIVLSLGGTAVIAVKEEPTYTHNGIKKIGKPSYRVTMTMPPGVCPFHSPIKADKFKSPTRGLGRWIDSIEPIEPGETICIKVAAADGLFVIHDYVVTHNTLIATEFIRHVDHVLPKDQSILMVSPLMVVPQTLSEVTRFYGDTLPVEYVPANKLAGWMKSGGRLGITNYDSLRDDIPQGRLGALILDECFAPGTLVDTVEHDGCISRTPIEQVRVGQRVANASGVDSIISTKRRAVPYAIKVSAGADFICSPNHPVFTQRGWVCAQDLEPGDSIQTSAAAVRMLRDGVPSEGRSRPLAVLRSILLSEMEDEPERTQDEMPHGRCEGETRREEVCVASIGSREGGDVSYCETESNEQGGMPGEGFQDAQEHGPQTFRAWGQRDWLDPCAEDFTECSWSELEGGVCLVVGQADSRLSHALQTRLGERRSENQHRSGWSIAPQPKGDGCEARRQTGFARVDGVAILQSGDPELEQFREADGKLYFYDLEAARHPSYSVGGLLVHNSSMLKSHYGKHGQKCIELGKGLEWKLCLTGTPAPNDRIEYGNHAVFLDQFPTINSFLAKYFVNRGQTNERWEIKPHALGAFYRALSHWCIFLTNPAVYGWKDNCEAIPPIHTHIENVDLTPEQEQAVQAYTGGLFASRIGGITSRAKLGRIAKGTHNGGAINTLKPDYIRRRVESWPDESSIVWCLYNDEQAAMEKQFPDAASIDGSTKYERRMELIDDFKAGRRKVLISKAKVLGFGLNLQIATRHVFSGLADSYESFYQCIKRSNRYGSTKPLNVHIPVTDVEIPMIETVLRKAKRVQLDTETQEREFKANSIGVRTP